MKVLPIAALMLALFAGTAHSQVTGAVESTSNNSVQSGSTAQNAGNVQGITFNSSAGHRDSTVKTTAQVAGNGFYGSYSSDNCVFAEGGGGVAAFVGANFVKGSEGIKCDGRRAFERINQGAAMEQAIGNVDRATRLRQAGVDTLCVTDDNARMALVVSGLCSDAILTAISQKENRRSNPSTNSIYAGG